MNEVTITCDRCGRVVHGLEDKTSLGTFTAGFYDVTAGYWSAFARWEEEKVCDDCMQSCPKYKKLYNYNTGSAD